MWRAESGNEEIESVQSTLQYIIPGGEKPVTMSNSPGGVRVTSNTGKYQPYPVTIQNGRLYGGVFSLDREGFVLVRHETKMKNYYDETEVKAVYYPEIEERVRQWTAAYRVL